jgi:hypothetical protein
MVNIFINAVDVAEDAMDTTENAAADAMKVDVMMKKAAAAAVAV